MCSYVCSVFYWLIDDALLMYPGVVCLRSLLPCFNVCWNFDVAGLGWYPCSRLKHNWSLHVECTGWGLMTVLNRGFIFIEHTTNVVIQQKSRRLLMMDVLMSETC